LCVYIIELPNPISKTTILKITILANSETNEVWYHEYHVSGLGKEEHGGLP
jgi:hypothetical protein